MNKPKMLGPTIPPQSSLVWLNQIASHVLCWGLWQRFRMKKPVIWFRFQMFWVLVEGFGILPKKMAFKVWKGCLKVRPETLEYLRKLYIDCNDPETTARIFFIDPRFHPQAILICSKAYGRIITLKLTPKVDIYWNSFYTYKYCDNTDVYWTCRWTHFSRIGSKVVSIVTILNEYCHNTCKYWEKECTDRV